MLEFSHKTHLITAIWAAKILLFSSGIISTIIFFKVTIIPYLFTLPNLWFSFQKILSLPLIYIIVNFIIITIVASSTFQHQKPTKKTSHDPKKEIHFHDDDEQTTSLISSNNIDSSEIFWHDTLKHDPQNPSSEIQNSKKTNLEITHHDEEIASLVSSNNTLLNEEQPRMADVEEEEEENYVDDTLDSTWKAITEGKGKLVERGLKKCETWDMPPRVKLPESDDPVSWARRELRKSDTFNDRMSLRREKSMSQDEVNLRSEAFIKKFNDQMKLQRQESYQRRMEMVGRSI